MQYLRLNEIIKMVDETMNCADVGADHGFVSIALGTKFGNSLFYAIENKKGPFEILNRNVNDANLPNVKCFLSDGLNSIDDKINTVIIAGMGGDTIISIVKKNIHKIKFIDNFIIDAHSNIGGVITFFNSIGYEIKKNKLIKEKNKQYWIILLSKTSSKIFHTNTFYLNYVCALEDFRNVYSFDETLVQSLKDNNTFISLKERK